LWPYRSDFPSGAGQPTVVTPQRPNSLGEQFRNLIAVPSRALGIIVSNPPEPELARFSFTCSQGPRDFFVRKNSLADQGVCAQIFGTRDYDLGKIGRRAWCDAYLRAIAPRRPLIVDCGANIGASTLWFGLNYPDARIVAIEPDRSNLELLLRNCAGLDVIPVHGAVSCQHETLQVVDPHRGEWGYMTQELAADASSSASVARVPAFPIDYFQQLHPQCALFIVKIDIEGFERRLFQANTAWIDATPLLIIELHDWIQPGSANSASFLQALASRNRDFLYRGENIFSFRNPL
jgi:FkbM family methyltransferase